MRDYGKEQDRDRLRKAFPEPLRDVEARESLTATSRVVKIANQEILSGSLRCRSKTSLAADGATPSCVVPSKGETGRRTPPVGSGKFVTPSAG
jgi:hypothetical protein